MTLLPRVIEKSSALSAMIILVVFLASSSSYPTSYAFTLMTHHHHHHRCYHQQNGITFLHQNTHLLMSSIGDGDGGRNNNNNNNSNNEFDDWLDPRKASSESENLKRARAQISEESLPINFMNNDNNNSKNDHDDNNHQETDNLDDSNENDEIEMPLVQNDDFNGKLELLRSNNSNSTTTTAQLMNSNPYLQVVAKLSPSELISKFTSTAHPRVQDAVRSTVLGLIGSLPKMAFQTTTITTGERLASLMFQLQLTGYMLKNADYRLSLSQSLGMTSNTNKGGQYLLEGDLDYDVDVDDDDDDDGEGRLSEGKVRGKIKITYGKKTDENDNEEKKDDDNDDNDGDAIMPSMEVEVDAAAYMAELRNEVAKLREDLVTTRKEKEDEIRKDLLLYIRTLPQKELKSLTSTLSDDVLNAMKGLVNVVMSGIGEGQIGPDTVTEQSGEAMAQLCMWQLVVGYNLRELEVREEMKNALRSGSLDFGSNIDDTGSEKSDGEGSIDFDQGGFE